MKKVVIDENKMKEFIENFILENGKFPIIKDFRKEKGSPYSKGVIEKNYGGIRNLCKQLGIEHKQNYKDKIEIKDNVLKEFINNFYNTNNKLPRAIDFSGDNGSPYCFKTIKNKYGSLIECYEKLGFNANEVANGNSTFNEDKLLDFINSYRDKNNCSPGINDFKRKLGCPYNKEIILREYGSIENMYNKFNMDSKPISKLDLIEDKVLLKNLLEAVYEHRTTDRDELRKLSPKTVYDRAVYERRFGSWTDALKMAGFTDYHRVLLAYYTDYKGEDPIEFLKLKIGKDGDFTDIQKYYIESTDDHSCSVIYKHFKSVNFYKIITNKKINKVGTLIIKQIAKDGHTCDSNAEKMVDDFLYENGFKHDVHVKYPTISKVSDFKVGDIYIEYAGLHGSSKAYDDKMEYKIQYCKENGLKLYVLYDTSKKSLSDMKDFINNN